LLVSDDGTNSDVIKFNIFIRGESRNFLTTIKTLNSHMSRIDLFQLPQTIRDAVLVCRKLGVRYLWVDALCIIQDSGQSKNDELVKMFDIYRNSFITILAASSSACDQGFIYDRYKYYGFEVPFYSAGALGTVSLADAIQRYDHASAIANYHCPDIALSRAWIFQEVFASSRIIIFSRFQVFWLCADSWGKDGGPIKREDYLADVSCRSITSPYLEHWFWIVDMYSAKEITDITDTFPAISSVATYFMRKMGFSSDQYCAGLWRTTDQDFARQLCWKPRHDDGYYSKGATYVGPSWSFLSLQGRHGRLFPPSNRLGTAIYHNGQLLGPVIKKVEVGLDSSTMPLGKITFAKLIIHGRVIEYSPSWSLHYISMRDRIWRFEWPNSDPSTKTLLLLYWAPKKLLRTLWDELPEEFSNESPKEFSSELLSELPSEMWDDESSDELSSRNQVKFYSLILTRQDEQYSRIGMVESKSYFESEAHEVLDLFSAVESQTITII
jgi:Heterokaryon incompatibility protein (HET)